LKQDVHCWHCGTPSARPVLARTPDGEVPACCAGCAAAVETIHGLGLGDYYCFRGEQLASIPAAGEELSLALFDLPELVAPFVDISGDQRTLTLSLDGVHCAACVWLIERALKEMPGVISVSLNLTTLRDVAAPAKPQNAFAAPVPQNAGVILSSATTPAIIPSLIDPSDTGAVVTQTTYSNNNTGTDLRTVRGNRVNVRGGPGTDYEVVIRLGRGDAVEILQDNGDGWVKMRPLEGGPEGWMADFLLTSS